MRGKQVDDLKWPCPACGGLTARHSRRTRTIRFLGGPKKVKVEIRRCRRCGKCFTAGDDKLAPAGGHYGWDVVKDAVLRHRRGANLRCASNRMRSLYGITVPQSTLYDWTVNYSTMWRDGDDQEIQKEAGGG